MAGITVRTTDAVRPDALDAVRALLAEAFGSRLSPADWEHYLGGVHVIATDRRRGQSGLAVGNHLDEERVGDDW